jgi:hypothetical protein
LITNASSEDDKEINIMNRFLFNFPFFLTNPNNVIAPPMIDINMPSKKIIKVISEIVILILRKNIFKT